MPRSLSIAIGLFMLLSVLATIAWLFWRSLKRAEDPAKFLFKWALTFIFTGLLIGFVIKIGFDDATALVIPFACLLFGVTMSVIWAPSLGAILAKPFTSMFDGGDKPPDPEPLYSTAISRRKMGKFEEAVKEIRLQLERFPNDFKGQMMIAEIQAEDLNDMPSAQVTIQRLCQQKGHSPPAISAALMRLADWQLKYWQDPDSARESLEKIIALFPDTDLAHVADQRISHLASTGRLVEAHDRPKIQLRPGVDDVGLQKDQSQFAPPDEDVTARAAEYVKHLDKFPRDADAREQLALIYAAHFHRVGYALGELEQIIHLPGQTPKQIVRVLNLIADIQIKFADDYEGAKQTLQRIVDQYPNLGAAEAAQRRLAHLKLELRGKEKPHVVALGTYEQDLGLKKKL